MNIKITKDINEANMITHGGKFHPDDVFSTVFMSRVIENPIVYRTTDQGIKKDDVLIYDIGFGKFDHHGPDALYRDNPRLKYCSFGLLWKEYGRKYLDSIESVDRDELFKRIDEDLIMQIDGIDNGVFPSIKAPYKLKDLDYIIDLFNNSWLDDTDNDIRFMEALDVANKIFDRFIVREEALIVAKKKVLDSISKCDDGILILDNYLPYEEGLWSDNNSKNIKVIIMPSNRGGYNIKPVTISKDSHELAYSFSKEFLGLHDEELVNVSGIKSAKFVHISGFIACTGTLEDAILMAKNAIEDK